jgi:CysZ protein
MISDFGKGFSAPIAGFRHMVANPGLWRYAVLPILLNVLVTSLVLAVLVAAALHFAHRVHPWFAERYHGSAWGMTLEAGAAIATVLVAITLAFVTWVALNAVLTGHFNGKLARAVEVQLGMPDDQMRDLSLGYQIIDAGRDLSKLLLINLGLLALNLVPVVGSALALVLGIYFDGFVFGFDYLDLPMELRGMRRHEKLARARAHRWETIGLGSAVFLLNFIPVVGSVFLATAATGAVLLHRDWIGHPPARDLTRPA